MTAPIFDHEKLKVYQEALRFVAWVDPILERLPGKLSAKDQLDRASTSTVLNLAEGKSILIEVVSMTAGLIARFSSSVHEEIASYGENPGIEEKEKE